MSSALPSPRFSPEMRATIFHSTVYCTNGVTSVYFGVWLALRGIEPGEIGIINAAPLLLMLLVNQLAGRIADRASDWRGVIIALSLLAGLIPVGLFFVSGFWGILLIWMLSIMPAFALVPITDAATLRMTQRRGTSFSNIRGWGTVGFLLIGLLSGPLISWLGDAAFVPLFLTLALLRALLSFQLPRFREQTAAEAPTPVGNAGLREVVLKPWFLLTLLGIAMLYATHSAFGAFAALDWHRQGVAEVIVGPLVAASAVAEAAMMFAWRRLNFKISARHLIIFACLTAAFRWSALAFQPPLPVLFGLQTLHAVTFAMGYLGGVYFIANWTSERIAAEAQGFAYVLQQGCSIVALLVMGWCYGALGHWAWLVLGLAAALGAVLVWLSLRLQPPTASPAPPAAVPVSEPAP